MDNDQKQKLLSFYNDESKHSVYQNFPSFVSEALGRQSGIDENWRGDTARYEYIKSNIAFERMHSIGDVGANTGRFCLDLAYANPSVDFTAIELNSNNIRFISLVKEAFSMRNVNTLCEAATYENLDKIGVYDALLMMNVLHHAGVDFDKGMVNAPEEVEGYLVRYLSRLVKTTQFLVFQLGYNWGGDKSKPIVAPSKPAEMIDYMRQVCDKAGWKIAATALYDSDTKSYFASDNPENDVRSESFMANSEFYKRPLYFLTI